MVRIEEVGCLCLHTGGRRQKRGVDLKLYRKAWLRMPVAPKHLILEAKAGVWS